jgi:hypothetical protein
MINTTADKPEKSNKAESEDKRFCMFLFLDKLTNRIKMTHVNNIMFVVFCLIKRPDVLFIYFY